MTHQEKSRAAFEKKFERPSGVYFDENSIEYRTHYNYQEVYSYQDKWEAWQAAIAYERQQRGEPMELPTGWREQFKDAVYDNLAAADNQDVPLEEYPDRILKVLDSIVGPRHPTVVTWRNDAIKACMSIAYKYCRDTESHRYLKQDLEALITTAPQPAEQRGEHVGRTWNGMRIAEQSKPETVLLGDTQPSKPTRGRHPMDARGRSPAIHRNAPDPVNESSGGERYGREP